MIPSLRGDDPGRPNPSKGCAEAIRRAGGALFVIDYRSAQRDQNALIRSMDALLLQGGGDVDPSRFFQAAHPRCGAPSAMRDELEFRAFALLFGRGAPMLGICRGCQVLNVALGGTLYQDLPSQLGVRHDLGGAPASGHEVSIAPGSMLMGIVGRARLRTNSLHHQSVMALGRGLAASARARDGVVEAIEMPGRRFFLGVQWHPEIAPDADGASMPIFDAFVRSI